MQRISDAEQKVRALTNQSGLNERVFASRRDDWNLLTVAMDTLGDSAAALTHFEACGLGSNVDERYIRLYGMFQAVILQQDAISAIYEIYVGTKLHTRTESAWLRCRRLRNLAVGHPLEAHGRAGQGKLRVFLSRATITQSGFNLLICQESDPSQLLTKSVDFLTPYNSYKAEALEFLEEVQAKAAML